MHAKTAKEAARIAREHPNLSAEEIALLVDSSWIEINRDGKGLIPPADLIIRPQHSRTSDVGWINGPTTELHLAPELQFPDMTPRDLAKGILLYAGDKQNKGA